ncbi:AbrB/MazE/SpoVT family DNA-binding domain-containing protein [Candidatus Acetothermia bacterium]|jgi:AbrB family looped-hinge helix DNA binding protein|nr:AbrB/MazE/SpoVT family DNA-binding domain-containing protein [Candidatus Acetothermia bacterium]MCI2431935.1 AbrB/MazE/SpoVT family DNA-binding domain-containing protein [Candidatus Acetothermia bacterium]MCI2436616.1 AbrB/MazE/SpoVT family DNA-binding domain-containing protein [Candidatus Acetothermia bacterium]
MPIVKVRAKRQVTIPKSVFEKLRLHEGDCVEIKCTKDKLVLKPVDAGDLLTPDEEKLVEKGFTQIRRREYVTWEELKDELDL